MRSPPLDSHRPTSPKLTCGACGRQSTEYICDTPTYARDGPVPDRLHRCSSCGTYIREHDFDDLTRRGHFDIASYSNPKSIDRLHYSRHGFFESIMHRSLGSIHRPETPVRVLDFGCGFGGLLCLPGPSRRGIITAYVSLRKDYYVRQVCQGDFPRLV